MRIRVNRDRCIGTGQCVLTAEEVFDTDDEGLVVLRDSDPGRERWAQVRFAAGRCPTRAISLDDGDERG